jgi:glycosyltransferase involved in cell wall biosynthesis
VHYRLGRLAMKTNRLKDISEARDSEVVFVNRDLAGKGSWLERRLLSANPRVIFDFDDAIFIGDNEEAVRWMCKNAAWVTPGNEYLAEYVRNHSDRVTVIPTVVDTERYKARNWQGETTSEVRVGWSGSDQSISHCLFPYVDMLAQLQERLGFNLVVITNTRPQIPNRKLRWSYVPWSAETEGDLAQYFDIGLMPLRDDPFQRGKCGLKLLQYMAAGLPAIASPVGVNTAITKEGETGFLAASHNDWARAIELLVGSHPMRASFGEAGRRRCESEYSVRRWFPELLGIMTRVAASLDGAE